MNFEGPVGLFRLPIYIYMRLDIAYVWLKLPQAHCTYYTINIMQLHMHVHVCIKLYMYMYVHMYRHGHTKSGSSLGHNMC